MAAAFDPPTDNKQRYVPARLMPVACAIRLALGIALATPLPAALAQSGYSVDGANRFVRTKDWNGLGRYATAWTTVEPNNPLA